MKEVAARHLRRGVIADREPCCVEIAPFSRSSGAPRRPFSSAPNRARARSRARPARGAHPKREPDVVELRVGVRLKAAPALFLPFEVARGRIPALMQPRAQKDEPAWPRDEGREHVRRERVDREHLRRNPVRRLDTARFAIADRRTLGTTASKRPSSFACEATLVIAASVATSPTTTAFAAGSRRRVSAARPAERASHDLVPLVRQPLARQKPEPVRGTGDEHARHARMVIAS